MRSKWLNPGLILGLAIIALVAGFSVYIASPMLSMGWGPTIALAMPLILNCAQLIWAMNPRWKIWASRIEYRLFGPSAEIQVIGTIPLHLESNPDEELRKVEAVARRWQDETIVDAGMNQRVIISSGMRTLMATFTDNEDEGQTPCLDVVLRGYKEKITALDDLLYDEIRPLLTDLSRQYPSENAWANLSLNLTLDGRNPFLGFYFRGVPADDIKFLQIRLDAKRRHSENADVEILLDKLSVQASDPQTLVDTARRFLASPPLPDSD